jgi:hypothetical protein
VACLKPTTNIEERLGINEAKFKPSYCFWTQFAFWNDFCLKISIRLARFINVRVVRRERADSPNQLKVSVFGKFHWLGSFVKKISIIVHEPMALSKRNCRCESLGVKCPSCRNLKYRQNKAHRQSVCRALPLPVLSPLILNPAASTPQGLCAIRPAPPKTEADRCALYVQHAASLFSSLRRGLDPREFKSGLCTAGKPGNKCHQVCNITRPRCTFHTAVLEGIEVKLSGMNAGLGVFASSEYVGRNKNSAVVFTAGSVICEVRNI